MRKLLFLSTALFIALGLKAKIVPVDSAALAAKNFYIHRYNITHAEKINSVEFSETTTRLSMQKPVYYTFNIKDDKGFVVVSAEDASRPVFAYAFEGMFYTYGKNETTDAFMKKYVEYVNKLRELHTKAGAEIKKEWRNLLSNNVLEAFAYTTPLLTTKWDQDCYYNMYTPNDPSGYCNHALTGCVATSMAQIMKYYNYPSTGYGSHSYTHPNYGTLSANFGSTTYNWSSMPDKLQSSSTLAQKQAVARLMSHCGISVDMNYGPNGSGSSTAFTVDAFSDYFRYNYSATEIAAADYSTSDWGNILRAQINASHPVLYSGSDYSIGYGHAWVLDGYQGSNYFHMNWGWSGSNNGYFLLTNLSAGGYNFTSDQEAVINIVPANTGCSANSVFTSKSGRIEDGSGVANYGNNLNCSWLISPTNVSKVVLIFDEFNTESSHDVLKVYDGTSASGTLLGTFSGSTLPQTLVAASGKMFITFTTNGSVTKGGWKAHWTNTEPVYCGGMKLVTQTYGTIEDGSGNNYYSNNASCKWLIRPAGASYIGLVFNEFDVHNTDHLYVYNGSNTNAPLLGSFTGNNLPSGVQSTGNSILLYFVSGPTGTAKGWKVSYYKNSSVGIEGKGIADEVRIYPNPAYKTLNIEIGDFASSHVFFQIFDVQGQSVIDKKEYTAFDGQNSFKIDISALAAGFYFVKITDKQKTLTLPFIKR